MLQRKYFIFSEMTLPLLHHFYLEHTVFSLCYFIYIISLTHTVVKILHCILSFIFQMWIFALGETLKRATLTSHVATSRLSAELCQLLTDMTRLQATSRASLMHLLDVSILEIGNTEKWFRLPLS